MITISWAFRGALGGETAVYSSAFAIFLLAFLAFPSLLLGIAILISAQFGRRTPILILSSISLIYFAFIYSALLPSDLRLYVVPFVLAITGSTCNILGVLLIRRKE